MKTNNKKIGNSYEREFAYKLSEWMTGEKGSDVCWRDKSSGSRHTIRKKKGKDTAHKADIIATELEYKVFFDKYYIDTKSYKEINLMFINPKNQKSNDILKEWKKTVDECPEGMIPLMPCKIRDRRTPEFIIFPNTFYINVKGSRMMYFFDTGLIQYNCFIILQDEFFELNKYKDFI